MSLNLSKLIFKGADVLTFLQGQITANINDLTFQKPEEITLPNHEKIEGGLGGICSLKGRLIATFWIIKISDEEVHFILPNERAQSVQTHLTKYLFRSKVEMTIEDLDAKTASKLPEGLIIPWITKESAEQYLPQMVSLDLLGGVSFNKGCYTGQEVVARMHFLGKDKRRLAQITLPQAGEINEKLLTDSGKEAGTILICDGVKALAVIYLEEAQNSLHIERSSGEKIAPISVDFVLDKEEEEA